MIKLLLIFILIFSSLNAEEFTGDKKTACEVIMCLTASGNRPQECEPPIKKFFKIRAKKWKDTIKKRKKFLRKCPVGEGNEDNKELKKLTSFLASLDGSCEEKDLNKPEINREMDNNESLVDELRVPPKLNKSCQGLVNSVFTNMKPKYTCRYTKWYTRSDWNRGYSLESISKAEYDAIEDPAQKVYTEENYNELEDGTVLERTYFRKTMVEKNCWVIR